MKIGILDSGIGGLSVLLSLVKNNLGNSYYYLGDNKNAPYGDKCYKELKFLTDKNIKLFLSLKIKTIIIACNTLSTTLKNYLKNKYKNVKFYFIQPYFYKKTIKNGLCYVLCTKKTAQNLNKIKIVRLNKNNIKVISCSGLVELIEKYYTNFPTQILKRFLPVKKPKYVFLGCTHYPLISTSIKKYYSNAIFISGISYSLKNLFKNKGTKKDKIYFVGENSAYNRYIFAFFYKKIRKVEKNLL